MIRRGHATTGFSLLEVILATAILAASAMVLSSLISLGAKYGSRAETRAMAHEQAQSLLDEFVLTANLSSDTTTVQGEMPGLPPRHFKITAVAWDREHPSDVPNTPSPLAGTNTTTKANPLYIVCVEITEGDTPSQESSKPLCRLERLLRRSAFLATQRASESQATSSLSDRSKAFVGGRGP